MGNPLITLDALQSAPGYPGNVSNTWASLAIQAATELVEGHCDRGFEYSEAALTVPESYEGVRGQKLYLRRYPVLGPIANVTFAGNALTDFAVINDPDDFEGCRFLYRQRGWHHDSCCTPPAAGFCTWDYPIQVGYRGGYLLPTTIYTAPVSPPAGYMQPAVLPTAITMACVIVTQAVLLRCPEPGLLEERTVGGWTKRWEPDKFVVGEGGYGLPGAAVDYLKKYKRRTR